MAVELSLASPEDLPAVRRLVQRCGLSSKGLEQSRWVFKAMQDGRLVGAAAIDLLGRNALCRSLAVERNERQRGVGSRLVRAWIDTCQREGIDAYLVTRRWRAKYFDLFGFHVIPRAAVPPEVKRHWQLSSFLYAVPFRPFLCIMESKLAP